MTEEMSLTIFDSHAAMVADLVKKDQAQEFDHTTEDGEKALRSWVYRVKCGKGDLEKTRKVTKADALAFGKKVDARAKELTEPLQTIIDARMKPLNEIEARKRAEAEAIVEAERVAAEKAEAERIADLERRETEIATKEEAYRLEQEEEDRIKREARIAERAVEEADRAAAEAIERMAAEKQEAIAAERKRAEAEAKVKEDARLAEENRIAEEKRIADLAEEKRVADAGHRKAIERQISIYINRVTDDSIIASKVMTHLVSGNIPHVKIEY